jgi:hypothetical protein
VAYVSWWEGDALEDFEEACASALIFGAPIIWILDSDALGGDLDEGWLSAFIVFE